MITQVETSQVIQNFYMISYFQIVLGWFLFVFEKIILFFENLTDEN